MTRAALAGLSATLAVLAGAGSAVAELTPITGHLSKPGYTVIALTASGRATSVRAKRGTFALRPRAPSVTLQLRSAKGRYAGPIVIRSRGSRAILGVRAGAHLGLVKVSDGYATLARRLPRRWVDSSRESRARHGVPIGVGVFGRVRVRHPRAHPGDRDADGIPDALDIDDDGDLILDNFDHPRHARASQAGDDIGLTSAIKLAINETVNANSPAFTEDEMEATLASHGTLKIHILSGDSTELDCGQPQSRTDPSVGGLVYCSLGGTGSWAYDRPPPNPPFPACCDSDHDGFGALTAAGGFPGDFFLQHGARTSQIGTGDVLIERVTTGGVETQYPATLGFVFATVPALVSYDDGAGNARTISYPVQFGDPGTQGSGLRVADGPDADKDIQATFSFWRPQRRPIAGESCLSASPPCQWVDIGRLAYTAGIDCVPGIPDPQSCALKGCPQSTFTTSDPSLSPYSAMEQPDVLPVKNAGGFIDSTADRAADPANTISYSLNLTQCIDAYKSLGIKFNRGDELNFFFIATAVGASGFGSDFAQQNVAFRRP